MPKREICPECGEDISGRDILAHRDVHYGASAPDPRLFKEAARRYELLTAMAKGAPE